MRFDNLSFRGLSYRYHSQQNKIYTVFPGMSRTPKMLSLKGVAHLSRQGPGGAQVCAQTCRISRATKMGYSHSSS